jgi:hypothetical protein
MPRAASPVAELTSAAPAAHTHTHRYGLEVGAYSSWLVRALMLLAAPVAWPMGKLLDLMLGKDHRVLFRWAGRGQQGHRSM